jgi:hypothetical protein
MVVSLFRSGSKAGQCFERARLKPMVYRPWPAKLNLLARQALFLPDQNLDFAEVDWVTFTLKGD